MDLFNKKKIEKLNDEIETLTIEQEKIKKEYEAKIDKNIIQLRQKDIKISGIIKDAGKMKLSLEAISAKLKFENEDLKQTIELKDKIIEISDKKLKEYLNKLKSYGGTKSSLNKKIIENKELKKASEEKDKLINYLKEENKNLKLKLNPPTIEELENYKLVGTRTGKRKIRR